MLKKTSGPDYFLSTHLIRPDQQAHQLRAIVREMRVCSATRNYIASEIGTLRRAIFYVAYLGLRLRVCRLVQFSRGRRNARTRLPMTIHFVFLLKHPGIQCWQIEVPRLRQRDLIECLFTGEKFGNRECRIFSERQIEARHVETGEVHPVVEAMAIGIVSKKCVVPGFELATEHQTQFQMQMCAFAVYARSGVTHYCDTLTARHRLPGLHCDRAEMSVQTIIVRAVPPMLDYDVFAIV